MKRFSLLLKMLLLLVVGWGAPCAFMRAQVVIEAIGEAIDLAELENGSSTPVVMRAGGDGSYGFVWYKHEGDPRRFVIDTQKPTEADLMGVDDATKYTFVLEKTNDGEIRIRENMEGGYIPQYSGTSRGGFSSVGGSNNLAGFFNYESAIPAANLLSDNHAYYLTPAKLTNPLTVSKNGNYFEVGGTSVRVPLQFFTYRVATNYEAILRNLQTLQSNLSVLYTPEALAEVQSILQSSTVSDNEKDAAINTFYASATGKEITLCNHHDYNGQGAEYMYANGNDLSTSTRPDAKKAVFLVESAGEDTYRLKSVFSGQYIAPTPNKSTQITVNKSEAEAGIYRIHLYPQATDKFAFDCVNSTSADKLTHFSLHRAGTHGIVTWVSNADASRWTISSPKSVNVKYVTDGDVQLPAEGPAYYWEGETTITPSNYDGYDVTPASATIGSGDITFTYSLKTTTPFFEVAKDYDSVEHWYFMSIHGDRYYMQYVDGQTAIPLDAAHRTLPTTEEANSYLWSFVQSGTANRYKIVNKVAGADKVLSNDKTFTNDGAGQNAHPLLKDVSSLTENDADRFSVLTSANISNAAGFYIGCDLANGTTQYMNRRSGLAYWYGNKNDGSTFIATEASLTAVSYVDAADQVISEATSLIRPVGAYTVPAVEGYDYVGYTMDGTDHGTTEEITLLGGTHNLKLQYKQKEYTVTYKYVDIDEPANVYGSDEFPGLHYGDALPEITRTFEGLDIVTRPEGTVSGNAEILVFVLDPNVVEEQGPTPPENVHLTYRYVSPEGAEWKVEDKGTVANGSTYPAVCAAPFGMTIEAPRGTLKTWEENLTVDIVCTPTLSFKSAETYDAITHWYRMRITNNKTPFHYTESDTYMQLTASDATTDDYLFAFVGNPFDGYMIFNKAAGRTKILSAIDPTSTEAQDNKRTGGRAYAIMRKLSTLDTEKYNTHWDFARSTVNNAGFFLGRHGETKYLNSRGDVESGKSILTFWTSGADGGSTVYIDEFDTSIVTALPTTATPTTDKLYRIYSNKTVGHIVYETADHTLYTTDRKNPHDLTQMWHFVETDGRWTLRNCSTGRLVTATNGRDNVYATGTNAASFYLLPSTTGTKSYGISQTADGSGQLNWNIRDNRSVAGWNWNSTHGDTGSEWLFEEVSDDECTVEAVKEYVKNEAGFSPLASGHYYRLVNNEHTTCYMIENVGANTISGQSEGTQKYDEHQIWKIEGDETDGYTFFNVYTGRYIKDQSSQSQQFTTTAERSEAHKFKAFAQGGDDWNQPHYAFHRTASDPRGLHCASSQSYQVVLWTYADSNATFWNLEEVVLSEEDLQVIAEEYAEIVAQHDVLAEITANKATYDARLLQVFTDLSCTELRPEYAALSDNRLRVLTSTLGLSKPMQDMAAAVKSKVWAPDYDETYNDYVRRFRINDYNLYTDRDVWRGITKTGGFAKFCNPTGVTVKTGEAVYIYVGDVPADDDVKVGMYIAHDTEYNTSHRIDLQPGINTWMCPVDGELIVDYRLVNPDKKYTAYPLLRVHVEGGEASGCWDATRNMDNDDWNWLVENMFTNRFLHVKGHSTMLNLITEYATDCSRDKADTKDVVRIMKAWDWQFLEMQRLIGNDGQWDERYRPFINPRYSYSGNPNWGGQGGSNHPTLAQGGYLFKLENFTEDNVWELLHEIGHGHQDNIEVCGTTEITNNSLSQMVSFNWGRCYSRGEAGAGLIDMFNYTGNNPDKRGWAWLDYSRYATPYYDYSLHVANQMLFHLFLYFDVLGNKPERDFIPRLHDKLREWGGFKQGNTIANPTLYYNDYWMLAKACAEVSQTDLWEFFEVYGFWKYLDEVISRRKRPEGTTDGKWDPEEGSEAWNNGVRLVGDYGGWYMKLPMRDNPDDVRRMQEMKDFMHSQPKKGGNIMFLEDRLKTSYVTEDSPVAQLDPTQAGQELKRYWKIDPQGDFGQYSDFAPGATTPADLSFTLDITPATKEYKDTQNQPYTVQGQTIRIEGDGLVGVKIYASDGSLAYIANTREFFVPNDVADKIANGEYTLTIALPDMTDIPFVTNVGDMNHDGRITIADLAILVRALRVTKTGTYRLDQVDELKAKIQQAQRTE